MRQGFRPYYMRFITKNTSGENTATLMRRAGYRFQGMAKAGSEMVFVRPISGVPYPRFHIYLKEDKETKEMLFNLHLDQKKPSYQGAIAHSGDYEGEVVKQEVERIKGRVNVQ